MNPFNHTLGCYQTTQGIHQKKREAEQKSKDFYRASDSEIGKFWEDYANFLSDFLQLRGPSKQKLVQNALDNKLGEAENQAIRWLLNEDKKIKTYKQKIIEKNLAESFKEILHQKTDKKI